MSNKKQTDSIPEIEYVEKSTDYASKRFRKLDILIFILCVAIAFIFWCYALYMDDPVIKKNVTVNFVLEGGKSNEFLLPASQKIIVYGEESYLSNINSITVTVKRSDFKEYNKNTLITIEYPPNIQSQTDQVWLQLNYIQN